MMTYRRDSKTSRLPYFGAVFLLVCLIIFWGSIRSGLTGIIEWSGLAQTRVYTALSNKFHGVSLYAMSNQSLYNELQNTQELLYTEQQKYVNLTVAEDMLRTYQKYATSSLRTVFATRIGTIDTQVSQSFRINIGSDALCNAGDIVINENNILLGTLINTDTYTSRVGLAWNGDIVVGKISNSSDILTLYGQKNGTYEIRAPRTVVLKLGDGIVLDIDPTIVVGAIIAIDENEGEPYMIVTVGIPFSPQSITHVGIRCQL